MSNRNFNAFLPELRILGYKWQLDLVNFSLTLSSFDYPDLPRSGNFNLKGFESEMDCAVLSDKLQIYEHHFVSRQHTEIFGQDEAHRKELLERRSEVDVWVHKAFGIDTIRLTDRFNDFTQPLQ